MPVWQLIINNRIRRQGSGALPPDGTVAGSRDLGQS
jgi:hypothetical protein